MTDLTIDGWRYGWTNFYKGGRREKVYGLVCGPCPICKSWHFHGDGEGHRVAHCADKPDGTSYEATGYTIVVRGEATRELLDAVDDFLHVHRSDAKARRAARIQAILDKVKAA